jgi:hydrogenase expression/formation protein HypE
MGEAQFMSPKGDERITLLHGAGGELMGELLERILKFTKTSVGGIGLKELDDGAVVPIGGKNLVFTTDSHVVQPLSFPGGDIGRLSVAGTVNDLAVMGAQPLALSCGLVIPEGFSMSELEKIMESMDQALEEAGAALITGDTKVLGHGELDGLIINTAGIGLADRIITDAGLHIGDKIIVTGTVGDHGMALMAHREGLEFETSLESDVAPINHLIAEALRAGGEGITAMKDPTRGGLAACLNDLARKSGVGITIYEKEIPLREEVRGLGELLGLSPLEIANEGKAVIGVAPERAEAVLEALRAHPQGREAVLIGEATADYPGKVILVTEVGGKRFLEPPLGDPVPRIC